MEDRLTPSFPLPGEPVTVLLYAVGAGAGGAPHVRAFDGEFNGELRFNFLAYDAAFTGGVRVATGDVTGDNFEDVITAAGPGGGPHVEVFDGRTGAEVMSFFAYDAAFTGGVFVAAGDTNDDGFDDVVTGAGGGGGPHVKVFSGKDGSLLQSFFAYGAAFAGGVTVAAGDVNRDGKADVITGAGPGAGPHVQAFDGTTRAVIGSFMAYAAGFTGGVWVGCDDNLIVTGAGPGGGPHVRFFEPTGLEVHGFMAYDPAFRGGVRVAGGSLSPSFSLLNPLYDVVTGPGPGGGPNVRRYLLSRSFPHPQPPVLSQDLDFHAFDPGFGGGVFVG
jgi:FG-GAP repeat